MRTKFIGIIFLFTLIFCYPATSLAQILIEQGKVRLNVTPGTTAPGQITVDNTSDKSIDLKAYWQDFIYVAPFDGKKNFLQPNTASRSAGSWISFTPQEFTLPPYGKKYINYTLRVPEDAQGGYYGVLFVEQNTAGAAPGKAGLQIIARVGSLFFIETEQKSKASKIAEARMLTGGIEAQFINHGNIILIPNGIYYIMDSKGMAVARGEIKKFYLPPKEKVKFLIPIPGSLKSGSYTAVLTFDLEEGDSLVKEFDFSKDSKGTVNLLKVRD